jgi:hypothetical protein
MDETLNKGEVAMTWQPMRIPTKGPENSLPGDRGRSLLWLGPPLVDGEGHWVHFSWKDGSFCVRDFLRQRERRQEPGLSSADVWAAAADRIPCKGELYVPVENFEFWVKTLNELTEKRRHGKNVGLWSLLSSKFASKPKEASPPFGNHKEAENADVYQKFIATWQKMTGFNVVERTVGCSARYHGEPLLWVYPSYFQVAPRGKGNVHHSEVLSIRDQHFSESRGKGQVSFEAAQFSWDRFQEFVLHVQQAVQGNGI